MKHFDFDDHFDSTQNEKNISTERRLIARPNNSGIDLIVQYLHNKYQANICHPISDYSQHRYPKQHNSKEPYPVYIDFEHLHDIKDIKPYIRAAQNQPRDYRQAFVIGENSRAKFMVYIREGEKEAILYSDSCATNEDFVSKVHSDTGVKVFTNARLSARLADDFSSYMDALVLGRDTTAWDTQTGQYRITNLIALLEKRVIRTENGVCYVKLPDQLLKTAQIFSFVDFHKEQNPIDKIHKGKTLSEFRNDYQQTCEVENKGKKTISTYLQQKGIKYSIIAQLQFYLNQIEQEVGVLSITQKKEFTEQAKKRAKQNEVVDLNPIAEEFLKSLCAATNGNQNQNIDNSSQQDDDAKTEKASLGDEWYASGDSGLTTESLSQTGSNLSDKETNLIGNESNNLNELGEGIFCNPSPEKNDQPEFGMSSQDWKQVANKGSLSKAKKLIDNQSLINYLAKNKKLYECAHKDAYFAKELLLKYPNFFTECEIEAVEWESKFAAHESKLCIQDTIETFHSAGDQTANNEALVNEIVSIGYDVEPLIALQKEAFGSRNLASCLLFFNLLYGLYQRKIFSLEGIQQVADSISVSPEPISETDDVLFFQDVANATTHQREEIKRAQTERVNKLQLQKSREEQIAAQMIKQVESIYLAYEEQTNCQDVEKHRNYLVEELKKIGNRNLSYNELYQKFSYNELYQKVDKAITAKEKEIIMSASLRMNEIAKEDEAYRAKIISESNERGNNDNKLGSASYEKEIKIIPKPNEKMEKKIVSDSYINMRMLSGFIAVIGVEAVAIAFITLNAGTFGIVGLAVAAIGVTAALLGGIGLFKYAPETDNSPQKSSEIRDYPKS